MDWWANSWGSLESMQEKHHLVTQQHSLDCLANKTEMHLEMTRSMETSMDPESLEILAGVTKMMTFLIHRIVLTVKSWVHRVSCHWMAPKETNHYNLEFEIVARVS